MKNARRTLAVAAALTLGVAAACTDITAPPKSTVTGANVFSDPNSYKQFLAKIYVGLSVSGQSGPAGNGDIQGIDEGFSQYVRLLWQMEELPTDEAAIAWNDAGVQELNTQKWSSGNQFFGAMYSRVFFQVGMANEFLRQTDADSLTKRGVSDQIRADVKQYRAEARFLRALSYWHGIDLFGDIPLVKETDPLGTTPPQQAKRADIYHYVVSELNDLKGDLPAPGHAEYGRADQGAALMLLAKLYLNGQVYAGENHYADARTVLEQLIASGAYHLDPSYKHLFQADNNTSPEMIFPIPQDGVHTQSYGGTTFLIHAAVGGSMDPAKFGIDGGWWGLRTKPEAYSLFAGDPRQGQFYTDGQTVSVEDLLDFSKGFAVTKFTNVRSDGTPGSNAAFPDTDFPLFRLGDAYLMYAEAVLRGGGGSTTTAVSYVNALRERAYGNANNDITAGQLTLDFIKDERARELFWEGHRRTDLVRFGTFTDKGVWQWKGNVKGGTVTESFRNVYPLPATELLANPNLKQNAGY